MSWEYTIDGVLLDGGGDPARTVVAALSAVQGLLGLSRAARWRGHRTVACLDDDAPLDAAAVLEFFAAAGPDEDLTATGSVERWQFRRKDEPGTGYLQVIWSPQRPGHLKIWAGNDKLYWVGGRPLSSTRNHRLLAREVAGMAGGAPGIYRAEHWDFPDDHRRASLVLHRSARGYAADLGFPGASCSVDDLRAAADAQTEVEALPTGVLVRHLAGSRGDLAGFYARLAEALG